MSDDSLYLDELVSDGVVSAETATQITTFLRDQQSQPDAVPRAWYVRFLVGFSAWLATTLFASAIAVFGWFDTPIIVLSIGVVLLCVAFILRRVTTDAQIFLSQLALVGSLLGMALVAAAVADFSTVIIAACVALVIASLLICFYADRTLRFLATWIAVGSLFVIAEELNIDIGFHLLNGAMLILIVLLWRFLPERWYAFPENIAIPTSFALPFPLLGSLFANSAADDDLYWLSSIFVGIAALVVIGLISAEQKSVRTLPWIAVTILFAVLTATEPALLAALTLLMLGFWRGSRVLTALAILAFCFAIPQYFDDLDLSLRDLSIVLTAIGITLLLARWLLARRSPAVEEA